MKIKLLLTITCMLCLLHSQEEREKIIEKNILEANQYVKDSVTRAHKFEKMSGSAFAFYRATAHLYYRDIDTVYLQIPEEWQNEEKINTWIQGDCHIQNLGIFDINSNIEWNANDFDESYIAPFYLDLIRFIASMHLFSQELEWQVSSKEMDTLAETFMREYQSSLEEVANNDSEKTMIFNEKNTIGTLQKRIKKQSSKKSSDLLAKWTVTTGDKRFFDFSSPKLQKLTKENILELDNIWEEYIKNYSSKLSYFVVKDKAIRLFSGLGSLGVRKYYVLIEGETNKLNDDVILEIKEQRAPSLLSILPTKEKSKYTSRFSSHSEKTYIANNMMLVNTDFFMGFANIIGSEKSYFIQKISPYDFSFEVKNIDDYEEFENIVIFSARALAYLHSRSDQDSSQWIDYSFEKEALEKIKKWSEVKKTICSLGKKYAQQTNEDYEIFLQLVNEGKIK